MQASHSIALHFTVIDRYCIFYKIRLSFSWSHFSNSICSPCVSISPFGNCHIYQTYYYICYSDLWSAIFDIPIVIVWGLHKPHSYKMMKLINVVYVPTVALAWCSLSLSLSSGSPISWKRRILKLGPLIILQCPLSVHVKGRVSCVLLWVKS